MPELPTRTPGESWHRELPPHGADAHDAALPEWISDFAGITPDAFGWLGYQRTQSFASTT